MVLVDSASAQGSLTWIFLVIGALIGAGFGAFYMKKKGISPFAK
jgi:hypothetical protein